MSGTTIPMPAPLCRLCMGDDPKLRKYKDGTADLICDRCWQPETTDPTTWNYHRLLDDRTAAFMAMRKALAALERGETDAAKSILREKCV